MKKQKNVTVEETARMSPNLKLILVRAIVIMVLMGISFMLVVVFFPLSKNNITQKIDPKKETESLMIKIGTLYDLPKGETPTIATVSDKTKLQKQSFFAKAENGDKVLIYATSKKAILYRPSINKLIEVAPLAINSPTETPVATTISPPSALPERKTVSISILNGTKTAGLASTAETKILEQMKDVEVVEKGNTIKDYTKTLIVDMSGTNAELAKKIADVFEGIVGSLPAGEKTPKGEIMVIMGK